MISLTWWVYDKGVYTSTTKPAEACARWTLQHSSTRDELTQVRQDRCQWTSSYENKTNNIRFSFIYAGCKFKLDRLLLSQYLQYNILGTRSWKSCLIKLFSSRYYVLKNKNILGLYKLLLLLSNNIKGNIEEMHLNNLYYKTSKPCEF